MPATTSTVPTPDPEEGANPAATTTAAPEAPSSSAATAPEAPPKPHRTPSALNLKQLGDMSLAEQICLVAQKPEYAGLLAAKSIASIFVTTLKTDVAAARTLSTHAVNCTTASTGETLNEAQTERVLVRRLRSAQTAARLAFADTHPEKLDDYLVGERIDQSRPMLEQSAQTILAKAGVERPGGIDTDFVNQAEVERVAYAQSNVPQVAEDAAAKAARAQRDAKVDSINQRRRKIQYAADLAWPAGVPANEKARKEFRLPAHRSFAV